MSQRALARGTSARGTLVQGTAALGTAAQGRAMRERERERERESCTGNDIASGGVPDDGGTRIAGHEAARCGR